MHHNRGISTCGTGRNNAAGSQLITNVEYSEKGIKELIEQYDSISFDMFDTIVMRKIYMPDDIFEIIENKLNIQGIKIYDFKKMRKEAEAQSRSNKIYDIYDTFKLLNNIDNETAELIFNTEINCEINTIIRRDIIVEIMEYAYAIGKKVSIISDMYFTQDILQKILTGLDIFSYDKIYVSCEYGVRKGYGLFSVYKRDIGVNSCLHIGDNWEADIYGAEREKIDAYYIMNAYDIYKAIESKKIVSDHLSLKERSAIGLMISEKYNNPFVFNVTEYCSKTGKLMS